MRKNTIWNSILGVLYLMMLIGEAFAIVTIIRLDMLPTGYLIALIGLLVLFGLVIGLLLFVKGKKPAKARRVIAAVLAILLLCGCTVLSTVATDVRKTIQATTRELFEIPTREIYVLAENPVQDLEETAGFTYGYVKNYDESCTQQVFAEIRQQIDSEPVTAGFIDTVTMVRALLENRIDAIVLSGGIVDILEDTEQFKDFSSCVRVLDQIRVEEQEAFPENVTIPAEETVPAESPVPGAPEETQPEQEAVDYTALEPFVVYVSGSDSYDTEIVKNGRSDVNILAVVNPMTKQVLLINTPRDYYVPNPAGKDEMDKLTHCGIYGSKNSMRALSKLYGVDIEYFVRINFTGFKKLIDALGGITVYSDYAFTAITRTPIKEGENQLDGQQALDFARERYTLKGGDSERGRHQMQVITAVIEKATSGTTIISNYSDIMASVEGMFTMNLPSELIGDLMKMQLSDMARWNVASFSVTGEGANLECYSLPGMLLSVTEPNKYSVSKASRLIDMIFDGELLTEEVMSSIS